jgi:hypothetical protein
MNVRCWLDRGLNSFQFRYLDFCRRLWWQIYCQTSNSAWRSRSSRGIGLKERAKLVFRASRDERRVYDEAMKAIPQSAALYRAGPRPEFNTQGSDRAR